MAVAILISVTVGDGLAPVCATLEVDVLVVGTSVNDVNVDTLTAIGRVKVLVPRAETQRVAVRDTGKAPWGVLLGLIVVTEGVDLGVTLDVVNLSDDDVSGSTKAGTKYPNGAITC